MEKAFLYSAALFAALSCLSVLALRKSALAKLLARFALMLSAVSIMGHFTFFLLRFPYNFSLGSVLALAAFVIIIIELFFLNSVKGNLFLKIISFESSVILALAVLSLEFYSIEYELHRHYLFISTVLAAILCATSYINGQIFTLISFIVKKDESSEEGSKEIRELEEKAFNFIKFAFVIHTVAIGSHALYRHFFDYNLWDLNFSGSSVIVALLLNGVLLIVRNKSFNTLLRNNQNHSKVSGMFSVTMLFFTLLSSGFLLNIFSG